MINPFPSEKDDKFMVNLDQWFIKHPINGTQETVTLLLGGEKKETSKLSQVSTDFIKNVFSGGLSLKPRRKRTQSKGKNNFLLHVYELVPKLRSPIL